MKRRLVLLHGFTGAPASFDELASLLRCQAPRLEVYRPLLLGHGAAAPGVVSFEEEVVRLAVELSSVGCVDSHLCGYSMGARLGLGLLGCVPHLFARATLIGLHPGLRSEEERARRRTADLRWCRLLEEGGLEGFIQAWQEELTFASQRQLTGKRAAEALLRQSVVRASHRAHDLARALRVLGLAEMPDYRHALRAFAPGVQLVVGALDTKFVGLANELAEEQSMKPEIVDGAGHNVVLEAPERVAHILLGGLGG